LSKTGVDFYDVEVINGYHMGIEMKPLNGFTKSSDLYYCGNPGATDAGKLTAVGGCTWKYKAPSVEYNWVTEGGNSCSS
jgi:hypothetical protein